MKKILVIISSLILLFILSFFCTYKIYRNSRDFSDEIISSTEIYNEITEVENEEAAAVLDNNEKDKDNQTEEANDETNYNFLVGELNGYIAVYTASGSLYEFTDIRIDSLDSDVKNKIQEGIKFQKAKEMFTFLESCSS